MTDYAYKWIRAFLPYSLERDDANIRRHLDKGWEEVPCDEVDRLPKSLIGATPAGTSGLMLYRMAPDAYWWTTLNLIIKANLALEFEHARLPGSVSIVVERD